MLWLLAAEVRARRAVRRSRASGVPPRLAALRTVANTTSVRLMEHAATLDIEDSKTASCYGRSTVPGGSVGRMTLTSQLFAQAQDVVTILAFGAGLGCTRVAHSAPGGGARSRVLGEAHFNAQTTRSPIPAPRAARARLRAPDGAQRGEREGRRSSRSTRSDRSVPRARHPVLSSQQPASPCGAPDGAGRSRRSAPSVLRRRFLDRLANTGGPVQHRRPHLPRRLLSRLRTCSRGSSSGSHRRPGRRSISTTSSPSSPSARDPVAGEPAPVPSPIAQRLHLRGRRFMYRGDGAWAVRHLDFTLKAGEVMALVGENGAGKTTIVKLLARLYDPTRDAS